MHKLYGAARHYTIMNKLLTNPGTIDKYENSCYNTDRKKGKELKTMKKVTKFFTEGTLKTVEEMTTEEKRVWIEIIENRMKIETFKPNQKNNKKLLKILRG